MGASSLLYWLGRHGMLIIFFSARNSHDYGITAAEVPERKELLSANPRDKKKTFHHCLGNLKGQDSFERDLNIEFFEDEGKFIVRKRASLTGEDKSLLLRFALIASSLPLHA